MRSPFINRCEIITPHLISSTDPPNAKIKWRLRLAWYYHFDLSRYFSPLAKNISDKLNGSKRSTFRDVIHVFLFTILFFWYIRRSFSRISSPLLLFFVSFSFLPQTNSRQVVQPISAIGEFSSRGSSGDARKESLRLIKKIERVLFPLELSSDEQAAGGDSGQVGHWENFIPSGYRMARRKRVARAANPISRGNLDRDEPRQTWRTMRRNFQRGRTGGV